MTEADKNVLSKDTQYKTLSEDFRSLNGFFWQIPLIMMTLNGGLWFSVASLEISDSLRQLVLIFAGGANFVMILAIWRLRTNMERLLAGMRAIDGTGTSPGGGIIALLFTVLLGVAAVGAWWAAGSPGTYFLKGAV